jgi:hypothetical protein
MIEATTEMKDAVYAATSSVDYDDARRAVEAVLAIVERDWNMQPNPNAGAPAPSRWRCNTTERCFREDGHDGRHAFAGEAKP